jgi:hypothetical protein
MEGTLAILCPEPWERWIGTALFWSPLVAALLMFALYWLGGVRVRRKKRDAAIESTAAPEKP